MMMTELNTNKAILDISREFDVPLSKVLSDLEKLREQLEGSDLLEELIYYYKCKQFGMD